MGIMGTANYLQMSVSLPFPLLKVFVRALSSHIMAISSWNVTSRHCLVGATVECNALNENNGKLQENGDSLSVEKCT